MKGGTNMKIHAAMKTKNATFVVSEAHGAGWEWGKRVKLRIVRVAQGAKYTSVRSPGVKVIEEYDGDARYTGLKSMYGSALSSLLKRLPAVVAAEA
jgi:hypothetical protein